MRRHAVRGKFIAALLAGCAGTAPVWAQDAAGQPAVEPSVAQPENLQERQSAEETLDANEIIVTARRREETLQSVPVAITAINTATMENKASVNIGDLQGAAPNLLITQQNSGAQAANLSIRGLTYADIEKSQEPTVGVVIDGVFIGTNTGQLLDFFDIEQIEVLRGPQGTLFGRNTIGGVINIRRTKPTMDFGVKGEVSYGRFDTLAARAVVNVPIGDSLGLKAFYFHNESDGFYYNAAQDRRAGGSNNDSYGATLRFKPVGVDMDLLLTVENLEQKFDVVNSNIAQTGELFCNFEPANECNRNTTDDLYTVFTDNAVSRYEAPAVTFELNFGLGDVDMTAVTGYRTSDEYQTQDFDASTVDLYYVLRTQDYEQWSQEIRFAGKISEALDYVVGGFYFKSNYNLTQWTRLFAFNSGLDPRVADANPQSVSGETESYAFFGDFNLSLGQFRVSFGGRYTHDHKELTNAFAQTGVVGSGRDNFSRFTPKVGVDWRPNDDVMVYASYSQGYRSGGFSPRAATAATAGTPFDPEIVDSYEIGTKLDLMDSKLQVNVAGFYAKYDGLQQNTTIPGGPTGNQTITSNVGSATIKGIEADLTLRPATGLRLTATAGYLDAEFDEFTAGNISPTSGAIVPFDYTRNNLIYAPKFSGSVGAVYTMPVSFGDITATADLRHISPYDQQISLGPLSGNLATGPVIVNGNDPRVRTKTQDLLSAALTANFKLMGSEAYLTVFGRNLLDQRRTSAAFTVAGLWSFASAIEPRTYGATLGFKF